MEFPFNKLALKKSALIFAWGLYDLANQFFALNIVSLYFVRWITIEKQIPELFYSLSFGLSTLLVACFAPFLGAVSDEAGKHRFLLIVFTLLSVIFTINLGLIDSAFWGLVFFAIANFGCQIAIIFYNSLLINIAQRDKIGLVSGIGRMLGYAGAMLGLYIVRPWVLEKGYSAAFIPSGLLFLAFALPCMLFVKDRKTHPSLNILSLFKINRFLKFIKQFYKDTQALLKFPGLSNFLKASFFCLCVVNTIIIFMSVYVTKVYNLSEVQLINLMVFSAFFAIVGSFYSGYISDRIGYKRSLIIIFCMWAVCLILGAFAMHIILYWLIGPLVAVSLGSTWVVARALAIKIVPRENIGQVFGLFLFVSYLSAIIGALFWGGLLWFISPLGALGYRIALLSLVAFLLPGIIYLRRI